MMVILNRLGIYLDWRNGHLLTELTGLTRMFFTGELIDVRCHSAANVLARTDPEN
jgi:hypothetical protein